MPLIWEVAYEDEYWEAEIELTAKSVSKISDYVFDADGVVINLGEQFKIKHIKCLNCSAA